MTSGVDSVERSETTVTANTAPRTPETHGVCRHSREFSHGEPPAGTPRARARRSLGGRPWSRLPDLVGLTAVRPRGRVSGGPWSCRRAGRPHGHRAGRPHGGPPGRGPPENLRHGASD